MQKFAETHFKEEEKTAATACLGILYEEQDKTTGVNNCYKDTMINKKDIVTYQYRRTSRNKKTCSNRKITLIGKRTTRLL